MIELKDAQEQLNRLIGLKFGPRAQKQREEVLRVMRDARTVLILEAALTSWIDTQPDFPKPSEIRSIIASLNEKHDAAVAGARKECIACAGSGWVQVRGISRFDGTEVTGARECSCRQTGRPVVADSDACATCKGNGLYGGQIGTGRFDGPWKWCGCPDGERRRRKEPELVNEANAAREKLIRKFGDKPMAQMVSQLAQDDQYYGDF